MLTAVRSFITQARDVRKSGRTLTVAVVLALAINVADGQFGDRLPDSNEAMLALILTPAAEYVWRKLRTAIGWDEPATP